MKTLIKGRVTVLGDNIDTDQIYPGRFLEIVSPEEIGKLALYGVDPEIAPNFKKGDIVVAGRNFGCGSSREHAPIALLNMGASVVIAESFARIFFRNSINLGLPLITCKGISKQLKTGDVITVDIENGVITPEGKKPLECEKLGEHAMEILKAGGIKPMFRKKTGVTE